MTVRGLSIWRPPAPVNATAIWGTSFGPRLSSRNASSTSPSPPVLACHPKPRAKEGPVVLSCSTVLPFYCSAAPPLAAPWPASWLSCTPPVLACRRSVIPMPPPGAASALCGRAEALPAYGGTRFVASASLHSRPLAGHAAYWAPHPIWPASGCHSEFATGRTRNLGKGHDSQSGTVPGLLLTRKPRWLSCALWHSRSLACHAAS